MGGQNPREKSRDERAALELEGSGETKKKNNSRYYDAVLHRINRKLLL